VRNFGPSFALHERFQSSAASDYEIGFLPSSGLSVQELCFLGLPSSQFRYVEAASLINIILKNHKVQFS
jgi:hypothetical protein